MRRRYEPPAAAASGVSLRLCLHPPALVGHARAELRARGDAELAVDARQVRLDGLGAHERGARDLAVRHSRRGELGDSDARSAVSSSGARRRPTRPSSARACSAQVGAPSRSKIASASPSASAAARLCLTRRCRRPWTSRFQPRSNGSFAASSRSSSSNAASAAATVALRREDERAGARERDADPEPGEAAPALLEAFERLAGAVALAQRDQRLDVERLAPVGRELLHGDRLHPLAHPRQGWRRPRGGRRRRSRRRRASRDRGPPTPRAPRAPPLR